MSDLKVLVEDLSLKKGSKEILSKVSISFASGQTHLLYGRNGAGKSSLIKCLLGFERKFRGEIRFEQDGVEIRGGELKKTFLPELIDMPDQIKIKEYIHSYSMLLGDQGRFDEELFDSLCKKFEIDSYAAKKFGQLSKGMKKLILIALTLSSEPDLIILDEPLEGLDLISKEHLVEILMNESEKGRIVVVSSHEVASLQNRFDAMISLRDGKITKELKKGEMVEYEQLLKLI
ncbi:MAG: ABC transporter ATP-binding protein [Balneolaceae bacterium]|nr:ABC transporter ATP-binding protein [Balneolaceae bacterium]